MTGCDVCNSKEESFSCASALGPYSFAYCQNCLHKNAEPADMVEYTIDGCDGLENVQDGIKNTVTFFRDGRYIPMKDWKP